MVNEKQFISLTSVVIDNFEGGYYHPDMLKQFNSRSQSLLKYSGETFFGIDYLNGKQLSVYPEWEQMWRIIHNDRHDNPFKWSYNYRGGKLELQLKELVASMMFKWFNYLAKKYILAGSMDAIANDERLIIHFSYASWNGEGWFQRFSIALNKAIIKYSGDKEKIFSEAIKARTLATNKWGIPNKVIRQQGVNMMALFNRLNLQ